MLFNVTGGSDLKLSELHEAAEVLQRVVDPDANIIFGMVTDLKMEEEVKLTVVATGFPTADAVRDSDVELSDILRTTLPSDDGHLDIPPFLRRMSKYRRNGDREMVTS